MVSVEELLREANEKEAAASLAKEKALKKAEAAKCAVDRARGALVSIAVADTKPVDKDQELALQLHLAMNGSRRISRSGRSMPQKRNDGSQSLEKVEFCMEDNSFFDSCNSSAELGKELKKEVDGCSSSSAVEMVVTKDQGCCYDNIENSSEDNSTLAGWITYKRASKSKGVGSQEKSSAMKQSLISIGAGEFSSPSDQISWCDPPDRYAKKYSKREKPSVKKGLAGESDGVPC